MGPSHVLADELFGMRQPRYDVALAIGNQFRRCCGQSVFLEMLGEPSQVEAGKYCAAALPNEPVRLNAITIRLRLARNTDPNDPNWHLWWKFWRYEGAAITNKIFKKPAFRRKIPPASMPESYTKRTNVNLTH